MTTIICGLSSPERGGRRKHAAMEADVEQLKAEQSVSDVDRKARLQGAIDQLGSKVDAQLQKAERG